MNQYTVKKVNHSFSWNDTAPANIAIINWHTPENNPDYNPKATAKIVHNEDAIIMQLTAEDDFVRNEVFSINGPVCDDSCMEVFIAPPCKPDTYFNLEINAVGIAYLGVGKIRENRIKVDPEIIKKHIIIATETSNLDSEKRGKWQLSVIMKKSIFPIIMGCEFTSGRGTGNFYKCGCRAVRHYLSWNPIQTQYPDFHTPQFFGEVIFED